MVCGSNPGREARFSAPVQKGRGEHPVSCWVLPEVKMSVLGLEHSPSKADVKEKVDIYCMSGYIMHLNFYL